METVATLLCLLGFQQAFFMWQIHKLVNKLMSRDLYDYKHATKKPKPTPDLTKGARLPLISDDEAGILQSFEVT